MGAIEDDWGFGVCFKSWAHCEIMKNRQGEKIEFAKLVKNQSKNEKQEETSEFKKV